MSRSSPRFDSPGRLVLSISLAIVLPENITERNQGQGIKGQMEMRQRSAQAVPPVLLDAFSKVTDNYVLIAVQILFHKLACFTSLHTWTLTLGREM